MSREPPDEQPWLIDFFEEGETHENASARDSSAPGAAATGRRRASRRAPSLAGRARARVLALGRRGAARARRGDRARAQRGKRRRCRLELPRTPRGARAGLPERRDVARAPARRGTVLDERARGEPQRPALAPAAGSEQHGRDHASAAASAGAAAGRLRDAVPGRGSRDCCGASRRQRHARRGSTGPPSSRFRRSV